MVRLDRKQRQEIVQQMHAEGMSSRAIASGLGMEDRTVRRDVESTGGTDVPPVPRKGLDGKTYQPKAPKPKSEPLPPVPAGERYLWVQTNYQEPGGLTIWIEDGQPA